MPWELVSAAGAPVKPGSVGFARFSLVRSPDGVLSEDEALLLLREYRLFRESCSADFFDEDEQRCWEGVGCDVAVPASWDALAAELSSCVQTVDSAERSAVDAKLRALRGRRSGRRLLAFRPAWEAFRLNGVYEDLYAAMRLDGVVWLPRRGLSGRRCRDAASRWLERSLPVPFEEDPAPKWVPGTRSGPQEPSQSLTEGLPSVAAEEASEWDGLEERRKRSAAAVWGALADDGVALVGWDSSAQRKRIKLACLRSKRDADTVYCWSRELGKGWHCDDLEAGVHILARKSL
jgi:hypothetical protein